MENLNPKVDYLYENKNTKAIVRLSNGRRTSPYRVDGRVIKFYRNTLGIEGQFVSFTIEYLTQLPDDYTEEKYPEYHL